MTPVDQEVLHDPENGKYGDCMRAAVASLLDLESEEVPHFFESGKDEDFDRSVKYFLKSKGLVLFELGYFDFNSYPWNNQGLEEVCHLISGYTERGFYHATVGKGGKVIHDPHPSKAGLIDKKEDWTISFLVKI